MGKISKKLAATFAGLVITLTFLVVPTTQATAADSVSVPGQVSAQQCPAGYQYSTGISVNATTGEVTTICNAPPTEADQIASQQDQDFSNRIAAAEAAAAAQSQAWNAANPGQQRCVQWGPIVHANGVSTSSGGVCANPVPLGAGETTPTQDSEPVTETVPILTPNQNIVGSNQPFFQEISGQVGTDGCPAGYQAANGLSVNVTTGQQTTQCWSQEAWTAYRLGGIVWEKYQATGGGYDVAAELDRREKLAALILQAKGVSQAAADATPGIKRCSTWTGYGETGQECSYTFINPTVNNPNAAPAAPAVESDASTPSVADQNVLQAPSLIVATSLNVVKTASATTTVKSLTPKVCKVGALKIKSIKAGTCTYAVTVLNSKGKKSTVKKSVVFVR